MVFEKMAAPGRKLLASGAGRCNLTHAGNIADFESRYGGHGRFLRPALRGLDNRRLAEFFEADGVPLREEEGGKIFPASGRARDVLDALLAHAVRADVTILGATPADEVVREGGRFLVKTRAGALYADCLALATGGASWPSLGSSGDGYGFARALGHGLVEPAPALAPVTVRPWPFAGCAGFALRDASVSVLRGGARTAKGSGDILFTHSGLSGPAILDLSRSIRPGDELVFPLLPGADGIDAALVRGIETSPRRSAKSIVHALGLPERLAGAVSGLACGDPARRACDLSRGERKTLAELLCGFRVVVAELGGFAEAMATRGGVPLDEVDPATMESRILPGLYFAGELLDVDGDTGGYNLQAAFSTGLLAGRSAAARIARMRG